MEASRPWMAVSKDLERSSRSAPTKFKETMPFKSKKQERFMAAHPEKIGGWSQFEEWAKSTPKNIPEKVKKPKK